MASVSELARLYEAVFGAPPSIASMAVLLRMEELLGLAQDDPLARMLILQLRVADQRDESYKQRSEEEKEFIKEIRGLIRELRGLTARVSEARLEVGRRHRGMAWDGLLPASVKIDAYRRVSPLWSYLGEAFRRCNGVLDADERIRAARLDLLYVAGMAIVILLGGMAIAHMLG